MKQKNLPKTDNTFLLIGHVLFFMFLGIAVACKAYPKKEPLLLDSRYHFYYIEEADIRELKKLPSLPPLAEPFPKFSSLPWKKYFSVLAYQKTSGDLRLISTVFTRQQVREFLPLFLDAQAFVKEGQRLLVVANDFPYRSISSLPSLTNFMIWSQGGKIHIIFGAINQVLFEFGRLSDPAFKVDFKDLKILQDSSETRLVVASSLRPYFRKYVLSGIHQQKWLSTEQAWFSKPAPLKDKFPEKNDAPNVSDDPKKDSSVIELDL